MVRSDFLIIADGAQVAEGKLYLLGAAWNRLALAQFPGSAPIAVAMGLLVGWDETNQPHVASLTLEDEDGQVVLGPIDMRFEVGRPAGSPPGEDQRVVMAVSGHVTFSQPGGFSVVVRLGGSEGDGEIIGRTSFRVTPQATQQA